MYYFLSNVDNKKTNENDKMWIGTANGKFLSDYTEKYGGYEKRWSEERAY